MIRPELLPKVRDQVLRHLVDPDSHINQGKFFAEIFSLVAPLLRQAWLGYATADMAALAMHSGEDLPHADWSETARPAPAGLMVFDGGIGSIDMAGDDRLGDFARRTGAQHMPIDAVSWGTVADGKTCWVTFWVSRARLEPILLTIGRAFPPGMVPPLIPICHSGMPLGDADVSAALPGGLDPDDQDLAWPVLRAVNAAWALMQQVTLVESTPVEVDQRTRKAYARRDRPRPEVALVDVRRRYRADQRLGEFGPPASGTDRQRGNWRWVVRGHWRNQACGTGRSERQRIWIADHWKGDADAPLLATTKVNVWRR